MGIIRAISVSGEKGAKKTNVSAAILKENFGIVGDAHAGGERQVSFLDMSSVDKMRQRGSNVKPGDFAENLTTEGLGVSGLCVGMKLRAGKDALLEITHVGKVCHRRCRIYDEVGDCVMPKEGVFAKVLAGGAIKVNDSMEVVTDEKERS